MKKLYQTLKHFFTAHPLENQNLLMLKCPEFLMKFTFHKSSDHSKKHFCYMDTYQLEQLNLLKQIGININQITKYDENL